MMLMQRDRSCLLLVDVQEKLAPYVLNSEAMVARAGWVMRLASKLSVPLCVTEQYPRGLGTTVGPLKALYSTEPCFEKIHFSCYRDPAFIAQCRQFNKQQMVLVGIETHVCVLQTAMDMKQAGFDVFVVVDAVSSRHALDHQYGLKRMKQAGVQLVTAEMVFFEWIGQAGTPEFKALSQEFLKG